MYFGAEGKCVGGGFNWYDWSSVSHAIEIGFGYAEHGEVVVLGDGRW